MAALASSAAGASRRRLSIARDRRVQIPRKTENRDPGRVSGWTRPLFRITGIVLGLGVMAVAVLQFWYAAHILWWKVQPVQSTAFMRAQLKVLQQADPQARLRHEWVPYDRISVHLKRAVIAAEDQRFNMHEGVDWDAIERAWERNQKGGRVVQGGSTITMQLAKNLFLSGERTYLRKAQELAITWMLEALLDKRRILEIYLNVAEWGVGVFGCEAGAQRHFRIGAAALGPEQAARMAAMLPRPRYFDRYPGSAALARRTAIIARWMGTVQVP